MTMIPKVHKRSYILTSVLFICLQEGAIAKENVNINAPDEQTIATGKEGDNKKTGRQHNMARRDQTTVLLRSPCSPQICSPTNFFFLFNEVLLVKYLRAYLRAYLPIEMPFFPPRFLLSPPYFKKKSVLFLSGASYHFPFFLSLLFSFSTSLFLLFFFSFLFFLTWVTEQPRFQQVSSDTSLSFPLSELKPTILQNSSRVFVWTR